MELEYLTNTMRDQPKAAIASPTTQFHWQDPSLGAESSREDKPYANVSVVEVAGSSPLLNQQPNQSPSISED